jgi:1-acyl-sn-glycerol-3-phosphate acyltransferase
MFNLLNTQKFNINVDVKNEENINNTNNSIPKSEDRLEVLEKIKEYEKEGKFDIDPEKDPPTIVLTPGQVDYLRKKYLSKTKAAVAYSMGKQFLSSLLKNNKLIIKKVTGIENWNSISTGAIITCNHFNPFDCFTVEKVFRDTIHYKNKKYLYKVIREGNYTNFPGFYGFLMRNCYTMPLSSNLDVMKEFIEAQNEALANGDFILMYPEQSLWWNYRKPKPLKHGAFKLAARSNVPVIPIFITMEDSSIIGEDGFPVQKYTINISEPIYPDNNLTQGENTDIMLNKNYEIWKEIYEDFYKTKLEYLCDSKNKEE